MGWPRYATWSSVRGCRLWKPWPPAMTNPADASSPPSRGVRTRRTPGTASAALVSIRTTRPRPIVDRERAVGEARGHPIGTELDGAHHLVECVHAGQRLAHRTLRWAAISRALATVRAPSSIL